MKATLDDAGTTLRLDFDGAEALTSFAADWHRSEGCLVRLAEPLKLWAPLTVELGQLGATRLVLEARVMQVFDAGEQGWATALEATEPEGLAELAGEPSTAKASAEPRRTADAAGSDEMRGASPAFRIREMNVSQRMRLASRATLTERRILLRDSSPQVLMGLLANPRIEDKEVLALVKSSAASSGVLQRIAKDRRWSLSYEIRLALVKNPQTPTPMALKMLETLRERDLRVLAKAGSVREAIRAAALRRVVKR